MRRIGGALMAAAFLFGNLRVVEAAPTFSQLVHPDAAAIAAAASEFASNLTIFAVVNGPMQRQAPALPKPTPPPLPPVPHLHDGEVHGIVPAPGIPGNAPAHLVLPLRLHLPPSPPRSGVLLRPNPLPPPGLQTRPNRLRSTPNPRTVTVGATPAPTGINHWWTYEEGAVTGIGKYMVNVANGNMVVQSDDIDVPERGIDLAFRRTYNSLSQHDYANTDGSTPSMYGDGWTNTFDAHIANNQNGISVFDVDGARYDYTPHVGNPNSWDAPAGQFATLFADISYPGYIFWMKKNGTVYAFFLPNQPASTLGYAGRLAGIFGRNINNNLLLTYSWDNGNSTTPYNLNKIDVAHSDGHALHLYFMQYTAYRLLGSVQRPDGQAVTYTYWTNSSTLRNAYEIVNNTAQIAQGYVWGSNHLLVTTISPRWNASGGTNDGGWMSFGYNANGTLQGTSEDGVMDPSPSDGTGTQLQPGFPTTSMLYRVTNFGYGSGSTTFADTDGHGAMWSYDSVGRVTQPQAWTGSQWLGPLLQWDGSNNLIAMTDARGNETDYAYDNSGNLIEAALPRVTVADGAYRPTHRYSYDQHNNITAYCDPTFDHKNGFDWTSRPAPSDSLCPLGLGASRLIWNTGDPSEPFGRASDAYTPLGYRYQLSYDGSFGLLTSIVGDSYQQNDGSLRTPTQTATFGTYGNLASLNSGNGAYIFQYDSLNRPISVTDPDNVAFHAAYYPNGQLSQTSTAAQYALDGGSFGSHAVTMTYDANGNELSETHHYNNTAGLQRFWYDGADRLVEVALPPDPTDLYPTWLTRYLYDLTSGGRVSVSGGTTYTFNAYGGMYKTQRHLPTSVIQTGPTPNGSYAWADVRGTASDALGRVTSNYGIQPGVGFQHDNFTYDTPGNSGLLANYANAANDTVTFTYDAAAMLATRAYTVNNPLYNGSLPSDTMTYDADGRLTTYNNTEIGPALYTYDGDGRISNYAEPTGGSGTPLGGYMGVISSPTQFAYGYYGDGKIASTKLTASALPNGYQQQYAYRTDGAITKQTTTYNGTAYPFSATYTNGGRILTKSDTYTNSALTIGYDPYGRPLTWTLPSGQYSNLTYDAESETTGFSVGAHTASFGYSVRGELLSEGLDGSPYSIIGLQNADGFLYKRNAQDCHPAGKNGPYCSPVTYTFDTRTDTTVTESFQDGYANHFIYDAAGRRVGWTPKRLYDGLNRLLLGAGSYAYGPGTIPVRDDALTHHASFGSAPIYSTDANSTVQDVKLSGSSDILPTDATYTGLTLYDRDMFGAVAASRNTTGKSGLSLGSLYSACDTTNVNNLAGGASGYLATAMVSCTPSPGQLFASRSDGYFDGGNMFRGARTYDSDTTSWSTPDQWPGSLNDPISELPFAYAGNNPAMFADPSGFCWQTTTYNQDGTVAAQTDQPCPVDWLLTAFVNFGSGFNPRYLDFGRVNFGGPSTVPIVVEYTWTRCGAHIVGFGAGAGAPTSMTWAVQGGRTYSGSMNNRVGGSAMNNILTGWSGYGAGGLPFVNLGGTFTANASGFSVAAGPSIAGISGGATYGFDLNKIPFLHMHPHPNCR